MLVPDIFETNLRFAISGLFDGRLVSVEDTVYGWRIHPTHDGRGSSATSITVTCAIDDATTCQQILQRYGTVAIGPTGQTMEYQLVPTTDGS